MIMTFSRLCAITLIVGFVCCLLPCISTADGVIVPVDPPLQLPRLGQFYSVKYHRVTVDIQDQVAVTTVEQSFINETDRRVEVEYIFPLPRNSQVNKFSLIVDDQVLEGRILPKDEARRIYEDIVRRQKDPALLEYIGHGMFRTNVFPLPPHGERVVKMSYTELLSPDGDQIEYRYPLNTEKFSKKVLEEVRIDVELTSQTPMKNVYSPTHDLRLDWQGSKNVQGHWADEGIRPENDFRLFWQWSEERIGATLFTYRPEKSEDGYFLFLASPKVELDQEKIIEKNVIMVLDVSGSMQGEKIEQARGAARFIARNVGEKDRFNIIFYNSMVDPLWDDLREFNKSARREALDRIAQVEANGGTDIHAALTTALHQIKDSKRPNYLIFLTDGLPTSGITDLDKITAAVDEGNQHNTRVFAFGVGYDVNAILLDRLGADNHGMAEYVPPGEDIEAKVSGFYSKIQNPALTDPALKFGDVRIRDEYPRTLPDIFKGGQLVLTGRYRDAGLSKVLLTGQAGDENLKFTYKLDFADKTDREDFAFVARLWAQRKIGWLIEQIRLHGMNKEMVDQIVELSTRYGIMTQYTSFLAEEDQQITNLIDASEQAAVAMEKPLLIQHGAAGVSQSMQSGKMKGARQTAPQARYYDESGREVTVETVKIIGSKTFYLKRDGWMDAEYKEHLTLQEIEPFSDEYFKLAQKDPSQAQYLTFAPDRAIIAVIGEMAYKILPVENN
jgi:Ca-activated chloride channel family protein